ncbi:MAG: hypothetical protein K2X11_00065 [Acetobacteraceae bacterium]|nr:hypothetical protein [Acetobacteraceae bacterium]
MQAAFASGHVADAILLLLWAEFLLLAWYHDRTGKGPSPAVLLPFLAAGAAFALALRAALTGAHWGWIAGALLAAFFAHLWDLARPLGGGSATGPPASLSYAGDRYSGDWRSRR